MKKFTVPTLLAFSLIFSFSQASAQDYGYKTIDVGAEFQHYSKGYVSALHLAYNFKVHHGIQLRFGYNKSNWKEKGEHDNEEGGGPGFSLGYRYYFLVRPHGFFLGARADWWMLNINWREGIIMGKTKTSAIQPTAEMGYMFLINDLFFISPSLAAGVQKNISTRGEPVGEGFVFLGGISLGWKF